MKPNFTHSGETYILTVTDPDIESDFLARSDGTEDMIGNVLCISLGENFGGYSYKLVASVITPEMGA